MRAHRIATTALLLTGLLAACSRPTDAPPAPAAPESPPGRAEAPDPNAALIERAARLELDTPYEPPPGDPLEHFTAGFARTLCSAVFVTGLDPDFAAENVGYFTAPYELRDTVVERVVDRENRAVHLTMRSGVVRSAKYVGDLGCVPLPKGESEPYYEPVDIVSSLPDPAVTPWPLGDVLPDAGPPGDIDAAKLAEAVRVAFEPGAMTAALVVTYRGQIVAERYAEGIDLHTPLESWSMGKSLAATLIGVLIRQGVYELYQPAPVPEWQAGGDPRRAIRIADILRMSSGLRCRAPQDPDADPSIGYYDHLYLYTGTADSFEWAATRPLQWEPNTVGRYRNCDPVLASYLVRLAVEGRGEAYHQFMQTALFDRIGVRNLVVQTDPYGNLLIQGSDLGAARDWARLGNLYLDDGVANGERILPEGWADFVSTVAPAWEADGRPIYGAFFWLLGATWGLDRADVYAMAGAGGQNTFIIPSRDAVVVRLGHYKGSPHYAGDDGVRQRMIRLILDAIPADRD